MDSRLMERLPANEQSVERIPRCLPEAGCKELSEYVQNQQTMGAQKALQREPQEQVSRAEPCKDIIL